VSEGGGREGGGADTELKTKTPHVNVGNKNWKKLTSKLGLRCYRIKTGSLMGT